MKLEWLILADAAEVIGNKLYVMGGGWDRLTVHTEFPVAQHLAVAVSIALNPDELGQTHEFVLDVQSPQGKWLASLEADFEVSLPQGSAPNRSQRWQFASSMDLSLDVAGKYAIVVFLNGDEVGRQVFEVNQAELEE